MNLENILKFYFTTKTINTRQQIAKFHYCDWIVTGFRTSFETVFPIVAHCKLSKQTVSLTSRERKRRKKYCEERKMQKWPY